MTVNTDWFRSKLGERQLSQRGLAKLMGLDSSAVSLMLRGRREMKLSEAAAIAALIGVPAEEVLANVGVSMRADTAEVPIVGILDGTGEITFGDSAELGTMPRPPGDMPAQIGAIQCRAAGSELDYMDRWTLFFHRLREGVDADSIERMSLVKIRGGLHSIGQVRRSYTRGRWDISCPIGTRKNVELEYATPVLLIIP